MMQALIGSHDSNIELSSRLELDILAGEVRRGGATLRLSRGEIALLVVLALQRRPCKRAELVELLYPHLDEATAAVQVKVYVHRVRRRLADPDAIVFGGTSYQIGSMVCVDFWVAESEIGAALRSKGPLSAEVRNNLEAIRRRLRRRNLSWTSDREWETTLERRLSMMLFDVTLRLGEAALEGDDVQSAAQLAGEMFDLDPCDERGAELAIRAHMRLGNHDGALRQYRRYERELRTQFEAKPSDQLFALLGAR